jgi:transcription elongation factor Elf1
MATDAYDVWDTLYEIMCVPCNHHDYCHGTEDEANDQQMIVCMGKGQITRSIKQQVEKDDIDNPKGVCPECGTELREVVDLASGKQVYECPECGE